jgi:DNA (cytosine-5)-methyltransferase 1
MRHLDLFSGIGGFALAAKWCWGSEYENAGHSEIEEFPCRVYHKHFPESKCLGDITRIDWKEYAGRVDLLTGGFPCQPFSVAGKRKGREDDRWLWHEMYRAIREIKPRRVVGENVAGIINMALDQVLSEMESQGYTTETFIIPACAVNAPHKRDRVWIIAYTDKDGEMGKRFDRNGDNKKWNSAQEVQEWQNKFVGTTQSNKISNVENATSIRRNRRSKNGRQILECKTAQIEAKGSNSKNRINPDTNSEHSKEHIGRNQLRQTGREETLGWSIYEPSWQESWFEVAARLCRVDDGVRDRVHRLKGLGNAIVPQVAYEIFKAIKQTH